MGCAFCERGIEEKGKVPGRPEMEGRPNGRPNFGAGYRRVLT